MADTKADTPRPTCGCGCGQTPKTSKSHFMPGHDRRFMGVLAHAARTGDGLFNGEDPMTVGARVFSEAGLGKLRKEIESKNGGAARKDAEQDGSPAEPTLAAAV